MKEIEIGGGWNMVIESYSDRGPVVSFWNAEEEAYVNDPIIAFKHLPAVIAALQDELTNHVQSKAKKSNER